MAVDKPQEMLEDYFGDKLDEAKRILKGHGTSEEFITNTLIRLCWIMKPMKPVQPRDKHGHFLKTPHPINLTDTVGTEVEV